MIEQNTENKIAKAANDEFVERGYSGARMQAIADKAGINKSLLHYYYRTKDKLFELVFSNAIKLLFPKIFKIFKNDQTLLDKIRTFTSEYIDLIIKNPHIPNFIIHELNTNPNGIATHLSDLDFNLDPLRNQISESIINGEIIEIDSNELIINIVSLCVFPIVAKPIIKSVVYNNSIDDYNALIEKRKISVANFVINSIKVK